MWPRHAQKVVARLIAALPPGSSPHGDRLAALPIGGSMWADYYLRPTGEVVIVGEDPDYPDVDSIHTDSKRVLSILIWGSQRYPELRQVLPVRLGDTQDCPCKDVPVITEGKFPCPECCGLGWLPAGHQFTGFFRSEK